MTHRKSTNNTSINEINIDGKSVTLPSDLCEVLNNHFISIGPKLASVLSESEYSYESYITPANTSFHLQHTTADAVFNLLKQMSPNKATGLDGISCRFLNEAASVISVSLATIVNKTIDDGYFPEKWKLAKVFPLFKSGERTDKQNYRPISVLSAVSKICERVIYDQLYSYLNKHGLLTKYQSGFRSLHSTVTAMLDVTNKWYLNIDKGLTNMVVFLDLTKAFDTVSHKILLRKMELYGIKGASLDWFTSYLSKRQQKCIVEVCLCASRNIVCGVPQGSTLGP